MTEALVTAVSAVLRELYGWEDSLELQPTRKEFEGDATLVVFPFLKLSRKSPVETANEIGAALLKTTPLVSRFNAVQGFLNLVLASDQFESLFDALRSSEDWGYRPVDAALPAAMV